MERIDRIINTGIAIGTALSVGSVSAQEGSIVGPLPGDLPRNVIYSGAIATGVTEGGVNRVNVQLRPGEGMSCITQSIADIAGERLTVNPSQEPGKTLVVSVSNIDGVDGANEPFPVSIQMAEEKGVYFWCGGYRLGAPYAQRQQRDEAFFQSALVHINRAMMEGQCGRPEGCDVYYKGYVVSMNGGWEVATPLEYVPNTIDRLYPTG